MAVDAAEDSVAGGIEMVEAGAGTGPTDHSYLSNVKELFLMKMFQHNV